MTEFGCSTDGSLNSICLVSDRVVGSEQTEQWIPLWAKVIGIAGLVVGLGWAVLASGAIPPLNRALSRSGLPGVRELQAPDESRDAEGAE